MGASPRTVVMRMETRGGLEEDFAGKSAAVGCPGDEEDITVSSSAGWNWQAVGRLERTPGLGMEVIIQGQSRSRPQGERPRGRHAAWLEMWVWVSGLWAGLGTWVSESPAYR